MAEARSEEGLRRVSARALDGAHLRYFDVVMAAFVTILLLSNVIGAGKVATIRLPLLGDWPFGAGILFFPISYVLGDVLTEVYGYARARRVIWAGTAAVLFMAAMSAIVVALPTVERALPPERCCGRATAGGRPSIASTSGVLTWLMSLRAYGATDSK